MNGPNNSIGWCDYTWNPVTGCQRNCWYCYVQRIRNYDRTPNFHQNRLKYPEGVRKVSRVFICSTGDLFGIWVPEEWIYEVLNITRSAFWHTFQILTKNPTRLLQNFKFEKNVWLGTTVEKEKYGKRITDLLSTKHTTTFVSFEPLLSPMRRIPAGLNWIIIGGLTGEKDFILRASMDYPTHTPSQLNRGIWVLSPPIVWINGILKQAAQYKIPVFLKSNLRNVWKGKLREEFPKGGKL